MNLTLKKRPSKGLLRIAVGAAVLLAAASAAGCGSSSDDGWPEGDFVQVGVKNDQPGTAYKEGYRDYSGFDIRVSAMAAGALGKEPGYHPVPSYARQDKLDGKHGIDLVVATYSITEQRLTGSNGHPAHDFVGPYLKTPTGFLVRKDGPVIDELEDLKDRKVCTWTGTTSEQELEGQGLRRVVPEDDAAQCVNSVLNGTATAAYSDAVLLYGFAELHRELTVSKEGSLHISGNEYYGIGLPKGHRKECNKIKEALAGYVAGTSPGRTWSEDFRDSLHLLTTEDPDWKTRYRPTAAEIDKYSCVDHLGS